MKAFTMKTIKFNIWLLGLIAMVCGAITSCSDDDLGPSIFDATYHPLDRSLYSFPLDSFVEVNYREPYNIRFIYKMEDIGTNMNYNLVPVDYQKAVKFAVLGKYLWYDVYKKEVGDEFLKKYTPHIIQLIGSPAYNANSGTEVLGTAEGGLKITLYKGNELDETSIDSLNEYFFRTMHHEFSHILHQNVIIPTSFRAISNGQYNAMNWQETADSIALSRGFFLQYASSGYEEDWVELIANYITRTDDQWKAYLNTANYGWEVDTIPAERYTRSLGVNTMSYSLQQYKKLIKQMQRQGRVNFDSIGYRLFTGDVKSEAGGLASYVVVRKQIQRNADGYPALDQDGKIVYLDSDGINGRSVLEQKLGIIKEWLKTNFNYDIDKVHKEVQRRQYVVNDDGTYKLDANGDPINALMQPSSTDPSRTVMDVLLDGVNQYKALQ